MGEEEPLLFVSPVVMILRGLRFMDTAMRGPNEFIAYYYIQPLYMPVPSSDSIAIGFTSDPAWKLIRERRWLVGNSERPVMERFIHYIETEGRELFAWFATPGAYARNAVRFHDGTGDVEPEVIEAVAYSYILADDVDSAVAEIDRLLSTTPGGSRADRSELRDVQRRAGEMKRLVSTDPAAAVAQLRDWAERSALDAGIPRGDVVFP